jgi:antitoxin YefM
MDAISYTAVRNNLAKTMDRVNEDHTPIMITRQNGAPAVLMSLEDFNAYQETAYLMRSPANAARLTKAVADVTKGRLKTRKLVERD